MKTAAKIRLIFIGVVTAIVACFFFFEPALNVGTPHAMSIFQEIKQGYPLKPILTKFFILVIAVFLGLLFLIGLQGKPKSESR